VRGDSRGGVRRPLAARLAHRALLRLYSAFLVVGRRNRDFYRGYGVTPAQLFDCPHFVDNERFGRVADAARPERAELRARLGVPAGAVCAAFVGKLQPVKDLGTLFAGAARARERGAAMHLLVVGEGAERPALERQAREAGLAVTFAGFLNQTELPSAYVAADLLVLPSRSETWGLVVNEAMACGLPAIVSDGVGCAPDLVLDGETGWSFPVGDAGVLAERLGTARARRAELPSMGERARRCVVSSYSVSRAVEGTLGALRAVARTAK
jgi:glycosyltransferase involved in cell wall biosynthesis